MPRLRESARVITSQNGEDGMLAELVRELGLENGWCVEFGAWDGKHCSNTWDLWANRGWSALLIEGNPRRFESLQAEVNGHSVVALCSRVGWEGEQSLDYLITRAGVPADFDLLSVDIDGDDYWVWEASTCRPKIVVIEHNASFAPEVRFVQEKGGYTGSSAAAFVELAKAKGYVLLEVTQTNLIFLREDQVDRTAIQIEPLDELFDRSWLPLVYSDYSGVHHLIRPGQWMYAGLRADLGRMRILGPLRKFLVVRPLHRLGGSDWRIVKQVERWVGQRSRPVEKGEDSGAT